MDVNDRQYAIMPWDSVDKYRDEDTTERRKRSRRRWNKLFGRRSSDKNKTLCGAAVARHPHKVEAEGSNPS